MKKYKRIIRRAERKTENVLGEDQFVFRRGKGTRDATEILRIISERTLSTDEALYACFIHWQKAFDCVKWTKLMQILVMDQINADSKGNCNGPN
jgi:hypothetical protein